MTIADHLNRLCKQVNPTLTQKLLTADVVRTLPVLGAQDGLYMDAVARLKLFGTGRWTWYATEACPVKEGLTLDGLPLSALTHDTIDKVDDVMFFGYVVSGLGEDCDELGHFRLLELAEIGFPPFRTPIERDTSFTPRTLQVELRDRWGVAV